MSKWFLLVFMILAVVCLYLPGGKIWAADPVVETSVVSMLITSGGVILEKDPFFEIFDYNQYILVPVNALSSRLPLNVNYHRDDNVVWVEGVSTKRKVMIDLQKKIYMVDNVAKWPEQTPVIFNQDFYVAPALIEYLTDVKIEWSSTYQELTVIADWMEVPKPPDQEADPDSDEPEPKAKYIEGAPYSIGSIRYELSWEDRSGDPDETEGSLKLRTDGRAGPWAISLGAKYNYETDDGTSLFPYLIRGKYDENNHLIILGDSDIYLENTLDTQDLRGILYKTPTDGFNRSLMAYTSISGLAEKGDRVILVVNGLVKGEMVIGKQDQGYRFNRVPLSVKRLNVVKVIVEKPNGEQQVTEERISSSLRILDSADCGVMAFAGNFGFDEEDEEWEGRVYGLKVRQKIFDKLSFDSESILLESYDTNARYKSFGTDTGLGFRLSQNTVCTLDWLIGGKEDELENGWKSSILYCLENGYFEGVIFSVNPKIVSYGRVRTDPGEGVIIQGELDVSERLSYETKLQYIKALPGMEEYALYQDYDLRQIRYFGEYLNDEYSIGLRKKIKKDDCDKEDLSRIYNDLDIYRDKYSLSNYLAYDYINYFNASRQWDGNYITVETDYVWSISQSLLYNLSTDIIWGEEDCNSVGKMSITTELQHFTPKWWNGGRLRTYYYKDDLLDTHSEEVELWTRYFFTDLFTADFSLQWNNEEENYVNGEFGLVYRLKENMGKYYGYVNYYAPYQNRDQAQLGWRLGVKRLFRNGLELNLEYERLYETLWDDEPENVCRLYCSQAVGFGSGRSKKVRNFADNLSFISGVVYLDENGNHQYDKNEKVLPDIRMSLNGRRVTSDQNGEYLFQSVEPGIYEVNFELRSLDADYTPVTGPKLVKIKENENMFFDFGLTLNGTISGKVFIDLNGNGIYDSGDKYLDWVGIALDGGKRKVYTGGDGTFYFENVPLGSHTIEILEESLPKDIRVSGPKLHSFVLKEGALDIQDIQILLIYNFE